MAPWTLAHRSRSRLSVVQQAGVVAKEIPHRGLQAAEAEVVVRIVYHRAGELEGLGVSALGQAVDLGAGRIGQAHQLAGLVEALTRGVIHGRAEHLVLQFRLDVDQQGVAAADDEGNVGLKRREIRRRRPAARSTANTGALRGDGCRGTGGAGRTPRPARPSGRPSGRWASRGLAWRRPRPVGRWLRPHPGSAARVTGTRFRRCSRAASSGTTPPYSACRRTCDETTLDKTRPS